MNYQKKMDEIIESLDYTPKLLLHACCAPCSSYVLEVLSKYFAITILYYNPNITEKKEFDKRYLELQKFISQINFVNKVDVMDVDYSNAEFFEMAKGLEKEKEGGKRCYLCYKLRMDKTASIASEYNFDYFTTTLSISPYKNAGYINEIGEYLEDKYKVKYLYADFKKKNGYKRSIELSAKYHLYRQDYCGCIYSKIERLEYEKLKNKQL